MIGDLRGFPHLVACLPLCVSDAAYCAVVGTSVQLVLFLCRLAGSEYGSQETPMAAVDLRLKASA